MTPNQNMILKWLGENIQRLFTSSPLFFKIWQIISLVLIAISWVPDLLNLIPGIAIPDLWNVQITLVVKYASFVALFMSSLVTQSPAIGVTSKAIAGVPSGTVIKTTDTKLPFTVQAEQNTAKIADTKSVEVTTTDPVKPDPTGTLGGHK